MPSQIRPNRLEVSDRFPMLGFTIKTDGDSRRYEVAVAADAALFRFEAKPNRTNTNFYSSRVAGLQPVERGEAVYVLPPEVLARFVGQQKLYYALATYPNGKTTDPEITVMPSEGSAYVNLAALTGRSLKRVRILPSRQRAAATYGNGAGGELDWAGDAAAPGTQAVPSAPASAAPGNGPEVSAPSPANVNAAALEYNDGFGALSAQSVKPSAARNPAVVRAQANESFSLNWDDVEPIAQPTGMSCWAASGAMVVGWRDRVSLTPETVATITGRVREMKSGLGAGDFAQFAQDIGLVYEPPQCYSVDGLRALLEDYGPLWVAAVVPGFHAIVVTGMYSDGAPDGSDTYVRVTDPWDRATGSPGAPGAYANTHNTGSRYILTWADFVREYEGAASLQGVNLQILHASGNDGRSPSRSGATGYAMGLIGSFKKGAAPLSSDAFTLNWDDVQLIPQPNEKSCWAAAGAMVIGWKDQVSLSPEAVAKIAGRSDTNTIKTNDVRQFASEIGMIAENPACYTVDGFRSLLERYGPLWVSVLPPKVDGHVVVVTGMYSDGAPDGSGTFVRISDPTDRVARTPNTASRYILSWAEFNKEYEDVETAGPDGSSNIQILHASGTGLRQPNRTGAAGYAMAAARALNEASEDDAHGIDGPIPDGDEGLAVAQAYTRALQVTPEYPQASRFAAAAAANYRVSSAPRTINRVVIHITDGRENINGPISWFQNPKARVSSHYIVGRDGEVVQMVRHNDVAWHASSANGDSIGIEHVANQGERGLPRLMPTDAEYCASALLTRWLCDTYAIPIDRTHVLGHSEADPRTTHTDCPNSVWDWDYFMGMVQSGSCSGREQGQAQALSEGTKQRKSNLPPPPPPVLRAHALDAKTEIASVILGAVMERIVNSDGGITWELDQLRGLKHPNDTASSPMPPFRDAAAIRLDAWPKIEIFPANELSAWFSVEWQYNGQSLGNVRITNVGTNGAHASHLHVSARIMDDNIVYPPTRPAYAALRVRLHYRFSLLGHSDDIGIIDLHLYGDGTFEKNSRWEQ